jgi:carboxypeptidase Q
MPKNWNNTGVNSRERSFLPSRRRRSRPGKRSKRPKADLISKRAIAVALLTDSAKHFNLLTTTGNWSGTDRPSASHRIATAFVANDHYALLYRLAKRPAPAVTRVEIDITNTFIPGPIAVNNTVGEIRGSEKPQECVIVGAHLDSWDLGQGSLDNGTGTSVVLETARILAQCGVQPKRTIRFILFTGEEQGLHGSRNYCQQHKAEMDKVTAALVHDTGTGKVVGLGWFGRPVLKAILENELISLKELGVNDVLRRAGGGSDHASFDQAGVPGCMMVQEVAGYRFAHHSQADTLSMAREQDLIQGAQVIAVMAMRLANLDNLLPRDRK